MANEVKVSTIQQLISKVEKVLEEWRAESEHTIVPWFRGEAEKEPYPVTPKLYHDNFDELTLLQEFRMRAPTFVDAPIPQRGHTDQWLFLARHVGLPTRLLDWTEGLLIALHFALYSKVKDEKKPGAVVWMLDPVELNKLSADKNEISNYFPLTWFAPEISQTIWLRKLLEPDERAKGSAKDFKERFDKILREGIVKPKIGSKNIRAAWEGNAELATERPVAILPTAIHPRVTVQRSTFTIWGWKGEGLNDMVGDRILRIFVFEDAEAIEAAKTQLRMLGISKSTLFPNLDSLAKDLELSVEKLPEQPGTSGENQFNDDEIELGNVPTRPAPGSCGTTGG